VKVQPSPSSKDEKKNARQDAKTPRPLAFFLSLEQKSFLKQAELLALLLKQTM